MSGLVSATELYNSYVNNYEIEKQKADAKYNRSQHRLAISFDLENIANSIYNDIINSAKKTRDGYMIYVVENGDNTDGITNYFNEIKCNSCIDVSGNDIINVLSIPILRISNNNLYDLSGGELGQLLIENMNIQGNIDISNGNIVVDASDNVLFKVSNMRILDANNIEKGTISESKLSDKILTEVLSKFDGVIGNIETVPVLYNENGSASPSKRLVFSWNTGGNAFIPEDTFT